MNAASELKNTLVMIKKQFMLLNCSILMSELGVSPKLRFWAKMSKKQTRNYEPLKNGKKKQDRLWNSLILMSEVGVRPKLRL